jgi:hypothetical protein
MSKKAMIILATWIFALGIIDVAGLIEYPRPFASAGWILTIIGIVLFIASNFMKNKKQAGR